jgi:methylated-DNA-protein-cysteine methyltransferase-like protein
VTFRAAVLEMVRRIPRGRVATYGQLAALLGRPRSARQVGQALRGADGAVPWHRVVNAQGGISRRARTASMLTQRIRLEQEGVVFRRGRVALSRFRWGGSGPRRRRGFAESDLVGFRSGRKLKLLRHDAMLGGQR